MNRALAAALVLLAASCSKPAEPPPPAPSPEPAPWPDARIRKLALAMPTPQRAERLELRHAPSVDASRAKLSLVFLAPEREQVIAEAEVPLAQRDAAWGAAWRLVAEPPPGERRAISWDGGASFHALLPLGDGRWAFCPHKKVAAAGGTPDWPEMLTLERWATGVLETAVWGCDAAGGRCKSRSLAGMTVHHSEPDSTPVPLAHEIEARQVVSILEKLTADRFLAAALLDASVTYQRGLDEAALETLGTQAAKALGPDGPLAETERKAMQLRVTMAREEFKKAPKAQISPRASIEALAKALGALPQEVTGQGK